MRKATGTFSHPGVFPRATPVPSVSSVVKAMLAVLALLAAATFATAQSTAVATPDPKTETRLKGLAEELRCLVCQNQTIADSSAPLAVDLRNQIRVQIGQGKSDDQIRGYMVQRYGDFVLYRPPFNAATLLLWVGPFVLVVGAFIAFGYLIRKRRPEGAASKVSPKRREELEKLLRD